MKRLTKIAAVLLASLLLAGCLSDGQTPSAGTGLPASSQAKRDTTRLDDEPRQVCESTLIGTETKQVCY